MPVPVFASYRDRFVDQYAVITVDRSESSGERLGKHLRHSFNIVFMFVTPTPASMVKKWRALITVTTMIETLSCIVLESAGRSGRFDTILQTRIHVGL